MVGVVAGAWWGQWGWGAAAVVVSAEKAAVPAAKDDLEVTSNNKLGCWISFQE